MSSRSRPCCMPACNSVWRWTCTSSSSSRPASWASWPEAYLVYGVGLRNILDRITLVDRRVKLELHDTVNAASTCWQFHFKDDPALAVLEPRAPTLCEAHLAGSSVAGSNRVPTLAFVIVFAGLLTAAAFCVRYLLAGIDVLKRWLLSSRREMSGRSKMARSVGGVKRS